MIRTRAPRGFAGTPGHPITRCSPGRGAALLALGTAASWLAACGGAKTFSTGSSSGPPSTAQTESAASYDQGPAAEAAPDRPGLGTEFGEQVDSRTMEVGFARASDGPFAQVAIHYNDAEGIAAQAARQRAGVGPISASTPYGGISIALVDDLGNALPGFAAGDRTYVVGQAGGRYNLLIRNETPGRYEVVASVDGLDVIDGKPAGTGKRGYIVAPGGVLTIDGFRTSDSTVAAFRFGAVRDSYAARTGDDRNVGVVGFAFFAERGSVWTSDEPRGGFNGVPTDGEIDRREAADPFPARYAQPPP